MEKLTYRKAFNTILLWTFLISGSASVALFYYKNFKETYSKDNKYIITSIIQKTNHKEGLKNIYLTELLNLSVDQPTNLYRFNTKDGCRKLLDFPLIKEAYIKKIRPGSIYVDYKIRQPVAFLLDFTNSALDKEGHVFPFYPFFTPKKLTEIYLGLSPGEQGSHLWGKKISDARLSFALEILNEIAAQTAGCRLERIDVSNLNAPSYGQREIVLIYEHKIENGSLDKPKFVLLKHILRINPDTIHEGIQRYRQLCQLLHRQALEEASKQENNILKKDPLIIDLRLKDLALLHLYQQ